MGVFLFFSISESNSQTPSPPKMSVKKDVIRKEGIPAAPGTYQFIVIPSEKGDPFTNDYLVMIENYRDQDQERILPLTQTTKVRIPSKKSIQLASFKPLNEIVYTPNLKPTR